MPSFPVVATVDCTGILRPANSLMPLKYLVRQAGWHGYLLLANSLLPFVAARGRSEGYDAVDNSAAIQIAYAVIIFLAAVRYLASPTGRPARAFLLSRPSVYLLLYVVMCISSLAWSERPLYSAYMGFECLAFLVLIMVVVDRLRVNCTAQDMVEWVMFWLVWLIAWRVLFRTLQGQLYYTIFRAGAFQTGIGFFLAVYVAKRKIFRGIVMVFALFSGINTMYASMVPGMLLGVFSKSWIVRVACLAGAVTAVIGLMTLGMEPVLQETVFRDRAGVGMEYTSGRDTMWRESLEYIAEKPFLGYGFVSGERDRIFVGGVSTLSVHNMLLSAALGVGIAGPLFLLLYFIETAVLCLRRQLPRGWAAGFLATVCSAFVFSIANPGLGGRVYGAWVATVFVITMISMYCQIQPVRRLRGGVPVGVVPFAAEQGTTALGPRALFQG